MIVEIRGTTTKNKGAQLMLEAIVERLGHGTEFSAAPAVLDYPVRARLGMYQTLHVNRFPRLSASAGSHLPREIKRRYGLISDDDITGVVDASGFVYSDSFGPEVSKREALYGQRWQRRGVPKVLLPQAYGPFNNREVAQWAELALGQANILFVRDATSLGHLHRLNLRIPVVVCPDFTIGLKPIETLVPVDGAYVAVVPNTKLITKGVLAESDYVARLVNLGQAAKSHGLSPLVVVHETSDRELAATIAAQLNATIFDDPRPRALKGAIGGASLLIGSRFHAIVGGLSQSVRTLVIGWSHKYEALLQDFDVPTWLVALEAGAEPQRTVARVLSDDGGVSRLNDARTSLLSRVDSMWRTTEEILGISPRQSVSPPIIP